MRIFFFQNLCAQIIRIDTVYLPGNKAFGSTAALTVALEPFAVTLPTLSVIALIAAFSPPTFKENYTYLNIPTNQFRQTIYTQRHISLSVTALTAAFSPPTFKENYTHLNILTNQFHQIKKASAAYISVCLLPTYRYNDVSLGHSTG